VVYGGGRVGLMGVLADAALSAGGEVIGVTPQHLVDQEIAHRGLTHLHVVADMHQRKARMAGLAEAFVALPGGAGTIEELFEAWTWGQLGLHAKPTALLDIDGFYRPLVEQLRVMTSAGPTCRRWAWSATPRSSCVSSPHTGTRRASGCPAPAPGVPVRRRQCPAA
jgi:uncharacterized protein (TIGR00730 family)